MQTEMKNIMVVMCYTRFFMMVITLDFRYLLRI